MPTAKKLTNKIHNPETERSTVETLFEENFRRNDRNDREEDEREKIRVSSEYRHV